MKVLAIDTATKSATAAITEDGALLGEVTLNLNKPHSQKIMPLIENLLKELELDVSDIDLFACAQGPGSFTGLRIGTAAIQGLSKATGKPAVGVSTLEAMARPFAEMTDSCVCPILDARRGQVYYALYKGETELIAPSLESVETVLAQLSCLNKQTVFLGDAVKLYKDQIQSALPDSKFAPEILNVNFAYSVAYLAQIKYEKKQAAKPFPEYLAKSYAEKAKEIE